MTPTSPTPLCLCGHEPADHEPLQMGYMGRCHSCECPVFQLDADR